MNEMKRLGKGREWEREITDQYGNTAIWHYKAVTRMEPFRFRPYLCWDRQRHYLSEFVRPEAGSLGLSLFDGLSPISYSSGVGIRLGDNDEGQLIYFYVC